MKYKSLAEMIKEKATIKENALNPDCANFADALPDGLNLDTVQQVREAENDFIAATMKVVGEMGHESALEEVTGTFDMAGIEVTHLYERKVELDGKSYENYMTTELKVPHGGKDGVVAKVRAEIAELVLNGEALDAKTE